MIRTPLSDGISPVSRIFAYCRVSTADQTSLNQIGEIKAAGFAIEAPCLVEERISGSVVAKERPGFIKLIDRMETGDVLVVTKLDRLGRNAMDVRSHCRATGGCRGAGALLGVGRGRPHQSRRKDDDAGHRCRGRV